MAFDAGAVKARMVLDKSKWHKSAQEVNAMKQKMAGQAKKTGTAFKGMWKQMAIGIGITGGITMVVRGLMRQMADTIKTGRSFEKEWANVTTMLDISRSATQKMKHELRMLSPTLGDTTDLAKGMYQVLSASIEPAKAIRFLGEAAKSAKAGVTETKIAVDAMTTVINAYGLEAEAATEVSDDMFAIVKRGKLNYEELATSLGTVVPVASTVGVKFKDVGAAVASLTRQGIPASKATMQLRQVFMAILKPSTEAEEITEDLGISMGKMALETKGLAGWLTELKEKTKGNADIMTKIVPNVRALTAVLALTGKAAEGFAYDQEFMAETMGFTDEAFRKQTESVDFWLDTFKVAADKIKIAVYEGLVAQLRESIRTAEDFDEKVTKATNDAANNVSLHVSTMVEVLGGLGRTWKKTDEFLFGWIDRLRGAKEESDELAEAEERLKEALIRAGIGIIDTTGDTKKLEETTLMAALRVDTLSRAARVYAGILEELTEFEGVWDALMPPSEVMARWDEFYNLVETPELDLIWEQQMSSMKDDTLNFMASIIPGMEFMTTEITDAFEEMAEKIKSSFEHIFSAMAGATSNFFTQLGALSQAKLANQMTALNEETNANQDALNERYEAEREAIENSLMSEEEKAEALEKLEEKKIKAQEKLDEEYDEKKKDIQKAAFESHKKISLITAGINIAEGITMALKGAIPPWNLILAGITAAAGAVQLAAISASEFPSAEKGAYLPSPAIIEAGHGPMGEVILPLDKAPMGGMGAKVDFNFYAPIISTTGLSDRDVDEVTEYFFDRMDSEAKRRGYSINGS